MVGGAINASLSREFASSDDVNARSTRARFYYVKYLIRDSRAIAMMLIAAAAAAVAFTRNLIACTPRALRNLIA